MNWRPESQFCWEAHRLLGSEGELIAISIAVEPRRLEQLLDALAELPYPINPQIYHDGWVERISSDGVSAGEPATIVEFPAYTAWLEPVRRQLAGCGFDPDSVWAHDMLEHLHQDRECAPAPPGSGYATLIRYRRWKPAA